MSDQHFDEMTSSTSDSIWSRMSRPTQQELRYSTASALNLFLMKDWGSDIPSLASVSYSRKTHILVVYTSSPRESCYGLLGICFVWHSGNVSEQGEMLCLDNKRKVWLHRCLSHLITHGGRL